MSLNLRPFLALSIATGAVLSLGACSAIQHRLHGEMGPSASATLDATRGNSAAGSVQLTQHGDHVMVHATLSGLTPGQEHGFHLHEKGDCSSGDGVSAGPHFNPTAQPHGPQDGAHHAGDLPALKADANGRVDAVFHLNGVTLDNGPNGVLGRGLIVHASPDDYKTQPTGNSGARIACGVIVATTR